MIPRGIQKSRMEEKWTVKKKINHGKINQGLKSFMEKEN
jgi:hypothetical protein